MNPSKARSNPTILTKKEADYDRLFPDSRPMETYSNSIRLTKRAEQFIKETYTPCDQLELDIATFYTFHVTRILVSFILKKVRYNDRDVASIEVDAIKDITIKESLILLKSLLISFLRKTDQNNLTYISKQIPFSEYITEKLEEQNF